MWKFQYTREVLKKNSILDWKGTTRVMQLMQLAICCAFLCISFQNPAHHDASNIPGDPEKAGLWCHLPLRQTKSGPSDCFCDFLRSPAKPQTCDTWMQHWQILDEWPWLLSDLPLSGYWKTGGEGGGEKLWQKANTISTVHFSLM